MKVGITTFGGDSGQSGISSYIVNLLHDMPRIASDDDQFEVLVSAADVGVFIGAGHARIKPWIDTKAPRSQIKDVLWHSYYLPRLCRSRKYDVLFLPAGNRRLPWSAPCPTVGTVHDMSWKHVPFKYDSRRTLYLEKVLPELVRRLDMVITVSESSKRDIVSYTGTPEERIRVVYNGADTTLFSPGDPEVSRARVAERYHVDGPYILYVSRIEHPGKNHVRLIRAYNQLRSRTGLPHKLLLVGADRERAAEVHAEARQSPYADDIIFPGFAARGDLPHLYRGCSLFVFPSLYEGFGIPVAEAFHCHVPVACSNVSALPEVAGDAAELFDPLDVSSIAFAMENVLTDPNRSESLIARGCQRAPLFTWQRTAVQTLAILRDAGGRQ